MVFSSIKQTKDNRKGNKQEPGGVGDGWVVQYNESAQTQIQYWRWF